MGNYWFPQGGNLLTLFVSGGAGLPSPVFFSSRLDRNGSMGLLVTGASGNLGSYLRRHLQGSPHLTAWSNSRSGDLFGQPLRPVDVSRAELVRAAFQAARPDAVLHAAAIATV